MEVAHGLLTRREVTSCLSLPPRLIASPCSCFTGDGADAPGPYIPDRLKSQHPQIPQHEKTSSAPLGQAFNDQSTTLAPAL